MPCVAVWPGVVPVCPGAALLPAPLFVWPGAALELPWVDVVVWPGDDCLTVWPGAVAVPDPEPPFAALEEPPDAFPLVAPVVLAAGAPLAGVAGVAPCVDDGPPDVDEDPAPEDPDDEWRPGTPVECCGCAAPRPVTLLPAVREPPAVVADARPVSEPEEALAVPPLAVVGVNTAVWAGRIPGGAD